MKYKAAKCTQCEAPLHYDTGKQILFCPYCCASYVIASEDNNREARLLEAATAWQQAGSPVRALEYYKEALEANPNLLTAWWGMLYVLTDNLTSLTVIGISEVELCWQNLLRLKINDEQRNQMTTYAKKCHIELMRELKKSHYKNHAYIARMLLHRETIISLANRYAKLLNACLND